MKDTTDIKSEKCEECRNEEIKNKAYEKVVHYVKEKIFSGQLKIGDKLPTERELSDKLELSRNSVREALRTLDNMGLIACRQGSGNYLTGNMQPVIEESIYMMSMLKQIDDMDICQLRRSLDILAMRLAVENFSDDDADEVKQLLDRYSNVEEDNAGFIDKEIHMLISGYSRNKLIELINDSLSITMEKFIFKARNIVIENEKELFDAFHKEMLISLLEHDADKGVRAINKHYDAIERYL
ncbi:MAG: GntR family transcriptional regulator [Clostridia bacterium]|nr:GntR family transcriptional regulator [Clostridia bacterium]